MLDTNIFIYLATDRDMLTEDVYEIIDDPENLLYISSVSAQELVIAYNNKNLLSKYWKTADEMIVSIERDYAIKILPVGQEHVRTYARLQLNSAQGHKDPYDHMVISHALTEHLPLISSDTRFPYYRRQGLELIEN